MASDNGLFRSEVIRQRSESFTGTVSVATPLPWQIVGWFLSLTVFGVFTFFFLASYDRVVTAPGTLVARSGVASVFPIRSGVVQNINVQEGAPIRRGDILMSIQSELIHKDGSSEQQALAHEINSQEAHIDRQSSFLAHANAEDAARLSSHVSSLRASLSNIQDELHIQEELIRGAQEALASAEPLYGQGLITEIDMQSRRDMLLTRQQHLIELKNQKLTTEKAIEEDQRQIQQAASSTSAQIENLHADRSELHQRSITNDGAGNIAISAPISGRATAVTARVGQFVTPTTQLMEIVPNQIHLDAQLLIPSGAIGFISVGQNVHIELDAFPFQKFGSLPGKIKSISGSAVTRADANGAAAPVYLVIVELVRQDMPAFGRLVPLLPGMTLSARIATDRQTIIERLLEPIYALHQR